MKAYVTKYALTTGVMEVDGEVDPTISATMLAVQGKGGGYAYYHRDEWHETLEAAMAWAEHTRVKRIESLKKSIAKLEKLTIKRAS